MAKVTIVVETVDINKLSAQEKEDQIKKWEKVQYMLDDLLDHMTADQKVEEAMKLFDK